MKTRLYITPSLILHSVKRSDVTRWKQGYITPPPPYFILWNAVTSLGENRVIKEPSPILHCISQLGENKGCRGHLVSQNNYNNTHTCGGITVVRLKAPRSRDWAAAKGPLPGEKVGRVAACTDRPVMGIGMRRPGSVGPWGGGGDRGYRSQLVPGMRYMLISSAGVGAREHAWMDEMSQIHSH